MKTKTIKTILGAYDLLLALGAIITGIMMIRSNNGVFIEYPKEWLSIVPFENWVIPGIISIVLFGFGNILAAILSIRKLKSVSGLFSAVMGGVLLICVFAQLIILKEWYLATTELIFASIIQLSLSMLVFKKYKK